MFTDFEYDGVHARDYNLVPCYFDSAPTMEPTDIGAELNFNMVSSKHGEIQYITDTTYDSVLETTFQVCKFNCENGFGVFTIDERREITRWLNRNEVHVFRLIGDKPQYDYVYFEGVFNVKEIQYNGDVVGFELHFISNRPYALGNPVRKIIKATAGYKYELYDYSDKVGYLYPKMTIKFIEDTKELVIHNSIEDRNTRLLNCSKGEEISVDETLQISSNVASHKIQNDFNYVFFRIANTYNNKINEITISAPCEITLEYSPIIKGVGF